MNIVIYRSNFVVYFLNVFYISIKHRWNALKTCGMESRLSVDSPRYLTFYLTPPSREVTVVQSQRS